LDKTHPENTGRNGSDETGEHRHDRSYWHNEIGGIALPTGQRLGSGPGLPVRIVVVVHRISATTHGNRRWIHEAGDVDGVHNLHNLHNPLRLRLCRVKPIAAQGF
jgi:hypothetical protein